MDFSEKLQQLRKHHNMTQEQLADNYLFPELLFQNGKAVKVTQISYHSKAYLNFSQFLLMIYCQEKNSLRLRNQKTVQIWARCLA